MLDTVLRDLRVEIALEGSNGMPISELWETYQRIQTKILREIDPKERVQPKVDKALQRYMWPWIRQLRDIKFYQDTTATFTTQTEKDQPEPAQSGQSEEQSVQTMDTDPAEVPAPQSNAMDTESTEPAIPDSEKELEPEPTDKDPSPSQPPKAKASKERAKAQAKRKPKAKKAKPAPKKAKRARKADDDDDFEPDAEESEDDEESDFDPDASDEDAIVTDQDDEDDEDDDIAGKSNKESYTTKQRRQHEEEQRSQRKRNFELASDIASLTYDEVEERYGDRLYAIASDKLVNEQVMVAVPPSINLSPNLLIVLKHILSYKQHGVTQARITKELELDPRSTGHYVKSLEQKGAITRQPISLEGMRTNLCVHIQFAKQAKNKAPNAKENTHVYNRNANGELVSYKVLRERMIALLVDAKDNTMFNHDILNALGFQSKDHRVRKWFFRSIDEMVLKGDFVRRSTNSHGKRCHCLALSENMKNWHEQKEENRDYGGSRAMLGPGGYTLAVNVKDRPPSLGMLRETSIERQIWQLVDASGDQGLTQKEIQYSLSFEVHRTMYKVLEKMVNSKVNITNKYAIRRQMEMFGKVKRFRYYTYQWYMKLFEGKEIEVTQPPLPEPSPSALVDVDFHEVPADSYRMPNNLKRALKAAQQTMDTSKTPIVQKSRKLKSKRPETTAEQAEAPDDSLPKKKRPRRAKAASAEASIKSMATAESSAAMAEMAEIAEMAEMAEVADTPEEPTATPAAVHATEDHMDDAHPVPERAYSMEVLQEETRALPGPLHTPETSPAAPETLEQREQPVNAIPTRESPPPSSASEAALASAEQPSEISSAPLTTKEESQPKTPTRKTRSKRPRSGSTTPQRTLLNYFAPSPVKRSRQAGISAERVSELRSVTIPSDSAVTSPDSAHTPEPSSVVPASTPPQEAPAQQEVAAPESHYKVLPKQPLAVAEIPIEPVSISEIREESSCTAESKEVSASSGTRHESGDATSAGVGHRKNATESGSSSGSSIIRTSRRQNAVYINKSGIVSAKHQKKKPHELAYVSRRKQVLRALLEERPIYERGMEFRRAFMDKQAIMFPMDIKGPFLLDLKTLWRAACQVAEEGDAAIHEVSCETLSGINSKKSLFMRAGMGPDSPEVKSYEEYLQNKSLLHPAMYTLARPEYVDRVETLDERLERLHEEQENQHENDDDDVQAISKRTRRQLLNATAANVKRARALDKLHRDDPIIQGNWSIIAVQYGFIPARLVRTGLMHEQFRRIYMAREEPRSDLITSKELLNCLTLAQYLQMVGVCQSSRILNDFIAVPGNLQRPVHELPQDLRSVIFSEKNKFRRRVRDMLDLLEYFGLIEAVHVTEGGEAIRVVIDTPANLALSYRFHRHVDLHQFRLEGKPFLRSYDLANHPELTQYWESVRYICQNFEGDEKQTYREPTDEKERTIFSTLLSRRNWSMNMSYTREQRERLNSYVNTKTGTTPHSNIQFCHELATELGVTTDMVRVYFKRMEQAFERKLLRHYKVREIRRLERDHKPLRRQRRRYDNEAAHKMISLDTKEPFRRHTTSSLANQVAKRQRMARKRATEVFIDDDGEPSFQDKETSLPRISFDELGVLEPKVITRVRWTKAEDELLMYMYTIFIHRAKAFRHRLIYRQSQIVLPNRKPSVVRHRIRKLLHNVKMREYIHRLLNIWRRYYNEGVASKAIQDDPELTLLDFDLLGHLGYFLERLNERPEEADVTHIPSDLPSTVQGIYKRFECSVSPAKDADEAKLQDKYHLSASMSQKYAAMAKNFLCMQDFGDYVDRDDDDQQRIVNLLKVFMRMILMTPKEKHDPFFSYAVMHSFTAEDLNLAINEGRRERIFVFAKGNRAQDRRLPGTFYGISESFTHHMASRLPKLMLQQAHAYDTHLRQAHSEVIRPQTLSSGMMACVLSMLSSGKATIKMPLEEQQIKKFATPINQYRLLKVDPLSYSFTVQLTDAKLPPTSILESMSSPSLQELDELQLKDAWSIVKTRQTDYGFLSILEAIMEYGKEVGNRGMTLFGIKTSVQAAIPSVQDGVIREAVKYLCNCSPPLLISVGFDSVRYVLPTHLEGWAVLRDRVLVPKPTKKDIKQRTREVAALRQPVILPRLWMDTSGTVTVTVREALCETIVNKILERPGISIRELSRQFSPRLTYGEVQDLVDILISRNAVRTATIIPCRQRKLSVFGKTRRFTRISEDIIAQDAIQHYWINDGYYNTTRQFL
ncbi:hypothetical protein BCR43DRAFT_520473 [Syncephalastrum racemosum]|uniref:Uncharacterized protein n=1 Tax=Syncephalastrum racemosum TaxID=13706 RepID=A0A1X2HUR1_SYNRA|nr:hypothetical protein BCR43DRAFT_520473 [Syncephalastrum racemosum]